LSSEVGHRGSVHNKSWLKVVGVALGSKRVAFGFAGENPPDLKGTSLQIWRLGTASTIIKVSMVMPNLLRP